MEKRTVLAFVLSFLVLIVWMAIFSPKQDQRQRGEMPIEKEPPRELFDSPGLPDMQRPVPSQGPERHVKETVLEVDEKEIEIDSPLYKAVFTNRGPTIKSFELKKYRQTNTPDSPLIELVSLERNTDEFFLMDFKTSSSIQSEPMVYQVDQADIRLDPGSPPQDLVFHSVTADGLMIRQTFRFYADQYNIDMEIKVVNQSELPANGTFSASIKALPPKEKKGYYSYVGLVLLLNGELEEMEIEDPSEEKVSDGQIDWMAYEDDYFISAIIPEEPVQGKFRGYLSSLGILEGVCSTPPVLLNPSQQKSSLYTLYFGPRDLGILKGVGKGLDRAVDFGWFDIIAKGLLYVLLFFNKFINNYGVSIILLTILVKILFWPLTHKSYKSMKEMQKLQPIMAKIREKYKNDKQKMNQEMMGLYKTYKVNPMSGCLPMLVQLPVFFALFRLLGSSIELRHAPFMLWINDLAAPDRLFHFPFNIPFMAPPSGIPVLTLLMGASMFIQQKMTPTPGDPAQAKMMMFMPIIFTFMFINFPSGLVLYWLVNNILSIGQQYRILKSAA
jgi:YidC/Oxa1 family membrane protein insertase